MTVTFLTDSTKMIFLKKKQLPKKFKVLGNEKKYPKYNKFTNKYCLADMWLLHLQNW